MSDENHSGLNLWFIVNNSPVCFVMLGSPKHERRHTTKPAIRRFRSSEASIKRCRLIRTISCQLAIYLENSSALSKQLLVALVAYYSNSNKSGQQLNWRAHSTNIRQCGGRPEQTYRKAVIIIIIIIIILYRLF